MAEIKACKHDDLTYFYDGFAVCCKCSAVFEIARDCRPLEERLKGCHIGWDDPVDNLILEGGIEQNGRD